MTETENKKQTHDDEIDLIEVAGKIWDGRKTIFKWMGIFFVIGVIIIIFSPKEYKSEVTLLVETGSGGSGMSGLLQQFGGLAGINLGAGAGEDALTPELYPDIIKSTPFLLEVMDTKVTESIYDSTLSISEYLIRHSKQSLGKLLISYTIGLPGKMINWIKGDPKIVISNNSNNKLLKLSPTQSYVIGSLSKRINAKKGETLSTLTISVEMQDPIVAAQFVDSVVNNLTIYLIEYRTQKAKYDLHFVEERYREAEARYFKSQRELAAFKDRNKNIVLAYTQSTEQNLQAEYNLAFNIYNSLSQQLEQSKMKLQEKTPVFKVIEPAKVALGKSRPKTAITIIGMVFLGSCLGIVLVYFNQNLKKKFENLNKDIS